MALKPTDLREDPTVDDETSVNLLEVMIDDVLGKYGVRGVKQIHLFKRPATNPHSWEYIKKELVRRYEEAGWLVNICEKPTSSFLIVLEERKQQ